MGNQEWAIQRDKQHWEQDTEKKTPPQKKTNKNKALDDEQHGHHKKKLGMNPRAHER